MRHLIIILVLFLIPCVSYALPAFPGAQGMGASSIGGRGGTVYIVDQLGDDAAAEAAGTTFREAVTASGPRIVTFAVSGNIWLESRLTISNDYLTIAGQTSPGGVCIAGYMVMLFGVHDIIIQHMRFRPGPLYEDPTNAGYAAMNILGGSALNNADGLADEGTDPTYNVIIDHCTFSWASDTNVNVGYDYHDVTLSWCYFTEPLYAAGGDEGDAHNLSLLFWGKHNSPPYGATVHHSYFGDAYYRVPETNFYGFTDQTNNVVYHAKLSYAPAFQGAYDNGVWKLPTGNVVGSYIDVRHADSNNAARSAMMLTHTGITPYSAIYMEGNVQSALGDATPNPWNAGDYDSNWGVDLLSTDWQQVTKFPVRDIPVTASIMNSAYALYVVQNAGANRVSSTSVLSPDSADFEAYTEYVNNTGSYRYANTLSSEADWPTFSTPVPPTDSDSDGMADIWEASEFGDLSQTAIGDYDSDGYNNIESYLHYLAGYSASIPPVGGGTGHAVYSASAMAGHSATSFAGYAE